MRSHQTMTKHVILHNLTRGLLVLVGLMVVMVCLYGYHSAQAENIKSPYFQSVERIVPNDNTASFQTLTVLINLENPPFGYRGKRDEMRGFNVDLAKALCQLIESDCKLKAMPHALMLAELKRGGGDLALSSFEDISQLRQSHSTTDVYFKIPARFFTNTLEKSDAAVKRQFANETVGVVKGSTYERFLRDIFTEIHMKTFERQSDLFEALENKTIQFGFSDGLSVSFWLLSPGGRDCCHMIDGPYLAPNYFGHGRVIVLRKNGWRLRQQLDIALIKLQQEGLFTELYLKHFPLSFY